MKVIWSDYEIAKVGSILLYNLKQIYMPLSLAHILVTLNATS